MSMPDQHASSQHPLSSRDNRSPEQHTLMKGHPALSIKLLTGWAIPVEVLSPLVNTLRQLDQHYEIEVLDTCATKMLTCSCAPSFEQEAIQRSLTTEQPDSSCPIPPQLAAMAEALGLNKEAMPALSSSAKGSKIWLAGWSLGGMLAIALADHYPERVAGVITLGANACFAAQPDWPDAMPRDTFRQFYQLYQRSPERALKRFVLLCTSPTEAPLSTEDNRCLQKVSSSKEIARQLHTHMQTLRGAPSTEVALNRGLALLGRLDNREALSRLTCPQLHLFADADALVPIRAAEAVRKRLPLSEKTECVVFPGVHTFLVDSAKETADYLHHFIRRHSVDAQENRLRKR